MPHKTARLPSPNPAWEGEGVERLRKRRGREQEGVQPKEKKRQDKRREHNPVVCVCVSVCCVLARECEMGETKSGPQTTVSRTGWEMEERRETRVKKPSNVPAPSSTRKQTEAKRVSTPNRRRAPPTTQPQRTKCQRERRAHCPAHDSDKRIKGMRGGREREREGRD